MRRLADGLRAAHELGAVHRDISPDNVLLPGGRLDQARIIDFGIDKDLDSDKATIVGDVFAGKLGYVAPEQFGDYGREVGPWTDVYSLGLLILAVACGRDVDMGTTLVEAVDRRRAGVDLASAPEDLQPILARMLTADPAKRLRSMDVVLLKLVGMNPVVVHGGGPQIEAALNKLGKKGRFIQGMRVTDSETMEVVEWVLAGEVQQDIVGLINQAGGKAVGLTGRDGGLIRAQRLKMPDKDDASKEHDIGFVGDIVSIDPSVVKALQDDAFIPVISPIGFGEENESYNINADVVAGKLATVLKAEKLVLLTNTPGVLDKSGTLLTDLTAREIDGLFADGTISGGMLPKIEGALDAARSGVNSVHIIDGRVPHAMLLEILTDKAYGTMIRSH
jgi:acetylglutamate kinase